MTINASDIAKKAFVGAIGFLALECIRLNHAEHVQTNQEIKACKKVDELDFGFYYNSKAVLLGVDQKGK